MQNDQQVALVDREKQVVDAESRRGVRVTNAQEASAVLLKRAEADFNVVTSKAQEETERLLGEIQSQTERQKIVAEQEAKVRIADADAELAAAQDRAAALQAEAQAEGRAATSLRAMREHKLKMAQFEVSENIAKNSKVVIGGDLGEKMLCSMVDFSPAMV